MGNSNSTPKSSFLSNQSSSVNQSQTKTDLNNQSDKKNEFFQSLKNSNFFPFSKSSSETELTSPPKNDFNKNLFNEPNVSNLNPVKEEFKNSLAEETIRNPGTVEDISKLCKETFPANFEGCRLVINKGLSNHFQISHTINLVNSNQSGYRFGATYVGNNMVGPNEVYPILLGDIDPSGNLNANIIHQLTSRLKAKFVAQFQDYKCAVTQLTTDYKGNTYTASCSLANVDLVNKTGIIVGHYLKNITSKFDLGTELAYQKTPQIFGGNLLVLSLIGRYKTNDCVISGSLQTTGLNICYYKKIQENLQVGVELNSNIQESVAAFAYNINIPKADLNFKASLNSNYQVCSVLEKKLQPLPLTFLLSGQIDHSSKPATYKFGLGLMLG